MNRDRYAVMKALAIVILALGLLFEATARNSDGTLANIIYPNNGVPALVVAGGSFNAIVREKADLGLYDGTRTTPLRVEWSGRPGGSLSARCTVPKDTAPGAYTLVATHGETVDRSARSVYVYDSFPEEYSFVHVSNLQTGSAVIEIGRVGIAENLYSRIDQVNASFVVITGNLTENGTPEEFGDLLKTLDRFNVPTFVNPGLRDMKRSRFTDFFGDPTYAFRFASDGFLSINTAADANSPVFGQGHARLQRLRREIKSSRWSVGFAAYAFAGGDIRTGLILFEDDALDYLVSGATMPGDEPRGSVFGGRTTHFVADGSGRATTAVQTIDVTRVRLVLHEEPAQARAASLSPSIETGSPTEDEPD